MSLNSPEAARRAVLNAQDFDQLHRRYGDRLVQSIARFVRDRDKAEEIAARAFGVAWEKRATFRGDAQPSTWIEAIARHEASRVHSRAEGLRSESIDRKDTRELPAAGFVSDELERNEDLERLKFALNQLPDKQRRALTAHVVEGLSVREVAEREQIPLGTALSRIHSGKQRLREAWDSYSPGRERGERSDLGWSR